MSKQTQNKSSINHEDILGATPLSRAVLGKDVAEVKKLLGQELDFSISGNSCALELSMPLAMRQLFIEKGLIVTRDKLRAALINQANIPRHAWLKKDADDYLGKEEYFSKAAIERILEKANKKDHLDAVMNAMPMQAAVSSFSEPRSSQTIAEHSGRAVQRLQSRSSTTLQR